MSRTRVVFMGTPEFAVPSLRALLDDPRFEVTGVVTQPDRPAGRGQKLTASPVKELAVTRGVPVFQPTKMKPPDTRDALAAFAPDVAVVAAYGRILPPQLLAVPRHGCINVHASLLPRFRGASPIARAIWAGDPETGVAIMRMEEGLDTGAVFTLARLPIEATDTTATLTAKLAELGARTLAEALPRIVDGTLTATPQPSEGVTHAPPLTKEDGRLDLRLPAAQLERQIRALDPWPGTFVQRGEDRIRVTRARVLGDQRGEPGVVLAADKRGVIVATGEGALLLEEVQPPGKKPMPAAAWVAGRGVAPGDRLQAFP